MTLEQAKAECRSMEKLMVDARVRGDPGLTAVYRLSFFRAAERLFIAAIGEAVGASKWVPPCR